MYRALWTGEADETWDAVFAESFALERAGLNLTGRYEDRFREADLRDRVADVEVLIQGYDEVSRSVLEAAPNLKVILSGRDGPEENVDIAAATELGIPVFSAGGRCLHSVAELTLGLLLNMARPMIGSSNYVREHGWTEMSTVEHFGAQCTELFGKTLSVIGFGRNGKELARIAIALGMRVVAFDPYVAPEVAGSLGVTLVDLDEAMRVGDYISVLARLTPETREMIGAAQIALMKPTACLVNTARARLTDEDAVFDALEAGRIRAAALDVFRSEPLGADHRAYGIPADRLILTPHIAGFSAERIGHQYQNVWSALTAFTEGRTDMDNLYNPAVLGSDAFASRGGALFGSRRP